MALREKPAALMIDVQLGCIALMEREDAKAYLDHLGKTLSDMRGSSIPVHWVTLSTRNQLYEAQSNSTDVLSLTHLDAMDFYQGDKNGPQAEDIKNFDIFNDFMFGNKEKGIPASGPRMNEAIFCKDAFGTFNTSHDESGNPGTMTEFLSTRKEKHGESHLLLMGTTTQVCCLKTATGAKEKGFDATALTDCVAGWTGNDYKSLTWREGGVTPDWHKNEMISGVRNERMGFNAADRSTISQVKFGNAADFITRNNLLPTAQNDFQQKSKP